MRRLLRHLNRQVLPENARRAGQDIAFRHRGIGQGAEAARIHLAAGYPDQALAAGAFAAAGGFDFHPSLPGRIEQPGPGGTWTALPEGRNWTLGIAGHPENRETSSIRSPDRGSLT